MALPLAPPDAKASTTTTYSYDAWGRLTGATFSGSGAVTTTYVYDAAGNRIQVGSAASPVANPVAVTVGADSAGNPVPLSVSGSYTSVAVQSAASHGAATASGTTITYTPTSGYTGADSFTYTASNSEGTSAPATVQVSVAPVANNGSATVAYDSGANPVSYTVTGAYTSIALAAQATHGTASASGTSMTYQPASGYFGADSFQYVAVGSVATSGPATISVTVNPQPPVAGNVSATVSNNTTGDNIPLSITGGTPTSVAVSTQASHGTATASGITIAYTPATNYVGADSFAYTARNAGGTSAPATAQITVTGLTATATAPVNCPTGAPTYICASGPENGTTFSGLAVSVTVTGGSGSYTYLWTAGNISGPGTWTTGGTTSSFTPAVTSVKAGLDAQATYTCTVTDTVTGKQATSNGVLYMWTNTS
jgi:YD repeat-containing protein